MWKRLRYIPTITAAATDSAIATISPLKIAVSRSTFCSSVMSLNIRMVPAA